MAEWSDSEAFWAAMEPALCAPERLALAEGEAAAILGALRLAPKARILDLACGPGAHAIAMARRGHAVTGVDRSRGLLDRARAAAQASGAELEWVEADMRDFRRAESFDLVCSLNASFGYFDDRQNRRVLRNVLASLTPKGAALLDLPGREAVARHWQETRTSEIEGALYVERRRTADDWSALASDWVVVRGGARADFRARQRLYSGTELRSLLTSVGFARVDLYGTLAADTPYDESARRLVAIAHARSPGK